MKKNKRLSHDNLIFSIQKHYEQPWDCNRNDL